MVGGVVCVYLPELYTVWVLGLCGARASILIIIIFWLQYVATVLTVLFQNVLMHPADQLHGF
jgi:hypothetical protein